MNTEYKLLTAVMMEVLYKHVTMYSYLPLEQRVICRGHHRCLDVLMIDSIVAQEVMVCHRSLFVVWIDY